jgi:hypothetical protein
VPCYAPTLSAASASVNFYEESAVKSKLPFFLLYPRGAHPERQSAKKSIFLFFAPFGRQSSCLQNASSRSGKTRRCSLTEARQGSFRKRLAAAPCGFCGPGRARLGTRPGVRCQRRTSIRVGSRLSPSGSRPKHLNRYSPTGDPSKPGTGTTLLSRGGLTAHPFTHRSPGPVLDATLPSSPVVRALFPPQVSVLHLFAWGSGVGSAGVQPTRNTQVDGAPKVPGVGGNRLRRLLGSPPPVFVAFPAPSSCGLARLGMHYLRSPID